jgi:hypothetical protein
MLMQLSTYPGDEAVRAPLKRTCFVVAFVGG